MNANEIVRATGGRRATLMDEMKRIVICRHCGKPEYYGGMRWRSGICSCRDCYKEQYEREEHKSYQWNDLNGYVPTMKEYLAQNEEGEAE